DEKTAQEFLDSDNYTWNSGMFFFGASTIKEDFRQYAVEIYDLLNAGESIYNTDKEQEFINSNYPKTPNISIDYAIMEKADHIYCLRADFGWSDLGTWGSLYDFKEKDQSDNVALSGKVRYYDASGNMILTQAGKHIILKDLNDYYILDEEDILLIWPRKDEDELPTIRKMFE
ncbi:MAG: mannose-1-phosphate guanylyltransferase, partial [Saprospiraceae bacterium]|nr:mannose-1-phosphate guanylyltransferase [Saprospiraceae bacterium]